MTTASDTINQSDTDESHGKSDTDERHVTVTRKGKKAKAKKPKSQSVVDALSVLQEDLKCFESRFMEMEAKRTKKEDDEEQQKRLWEEQEMTTRRWETAENQRQEEFLGNLLETLIGNK